MEKLHTRMVQFSSNKFGNIVPIQAIPGHFVTSHSHVNYFIDLTMLKSSQEDAQKCAHALASQYKDIDSIDTIICLDGTGIIGAFLSVELQKKTPASEHKKIYVICPECANNGQMFFRENVEPMVCEKNVILLMATVTTGISIAAAWNALSITAAISKAYVPYLVPLQTWTVLPSIISSPQTTFRATHRISAATVRFAKATRRLEALVNSYGYSQL